MVRRWDQWKNPWDREYAKRGQLWRGRADLGPLKDLVEPGQRVVELGCGDGKFLAELGNAGYRWIGVDFSKHALKQAARAGTGERVLADVRALPIADRIAPVVVARYVLGSLRMKGRVSAAKEIVRILASSGWLLVEDFSVDDFRHGVGNPVEPGSFERNQGILSHYFAAGEIERLFTSLTAISAEVVTREQRVTGGREHRASHRVVLRK